MIAVQSLQAEPLYTVPSISLNSVSVIFWNKATESCCPSRQSIPSVPSTHAQDWSDAQNNEFVWALCLPQMQLSFTEPGNNLLGRQKAQTLHLQGNSCYASAEKGQFCLVMGMLMSLFIKDCIPHTQGSRHHFTVYRKIKISSVSRHFLWMATNLNNPLDQNCPSIQDEPDRWV